MLVYGTKVMSQSQPEKSSFPSYEFELVLPSGHSATYFLEDMAAAEGRGAHQGIVPRTMRHREYTPPADGLVHSTEHWPFRNGQVFSVRRATLGEVEKLFLDTVGLLENFRKEASRDVRLQVNRVLSVVTREGEIKRISEPFPEEEQIHGLPSHSGLRRIAAPRFQGMVKVDPTDDPRRFGTILGVLGRQRKSLEILRLGFTDKQTEIILGPSERLQAKQRDILHRRAGRRQRLEDEKQPSEYIAHLISEIRRSLIEAGIRHCGVVTFENLGLFAY